ncbi:hypothetical protein IT575_08115 [bacterium]|nr:hypothetical protein [bacterium]
MFKNAVIVMMVLGTLAVASCSGGAGAPIDEMNAGNAATTQAQPEAQTSQDQNGQYSSVQWQAQVDSPLLPRDASFWADLFPDFDLPDWGDIFDAMHSAVAHGENDIPTDAFMAGSNGARYEMTAVDWSDGGGFPLPVMGYGLVLESTAEQPAFATFGLKEFPAGERIKSVEVSGWGEDLWIGVAGYGSKDAYRWFGPYNLGEGDATLTLPYMDSTNDSNYGYVTLLSAGGDYVTVSSLKVNVGPQTLTPDIDFDFEIDPIIPDWDI